MHADHRVRVHMHVRLLVTPPSYKTQKARGLGPEAGPDTSPPVQVETPIVVRALIGPWFKHMLSFFAVFIFVCVPSKVSADAVGSSRVPVWYYRIKFPVTGNGRLARRHWDHTFSASEAADDFSLI